LCADAAAAAAAADGGDRQLNGGDNWHTHFGLHSFQSIVFDIEFQKVTLSFLAIMHFLFGTSIEERDPLALLPSTHSANNSNFPISLWQTDLRQDYVTPPFIHNPAAICDVVFNFDSRRERK
jgi:hypothetical protein